MLVRMGRSADIARVAKASGHDFIFMDVQHGIMGLETIAHIANAALAIGITPVVRARSVDDPDVSVLLDNGVTGIVFPDVNTPAQAQRAVEICRFAPQGKRSAGGPVPHFNYQPMPVQELTSALNENTLVAVMIETVQGLENVEAIAAVEGIDVVHIGANDLLLDMGLPGQFDTPELNMAVDRVIAAAAATGKFSGCGGNRNVQRQAEVINRGVRFITTQSDVAFLAASAAPWVDGIRDKT
jgi:2-keto-3-deoxy-L-rhamnonate aldolase RhmA